MKEQGPPQKQHYLPVIYLQQFSVDGCNSLRKSQIWRLGHNSHEAVSVESQCHERFFYSASDPSSAEKLFQSSEKTYASLARLVWKWRQNRTDKEYFALILMIISLHLRSASYEVRQKRARIETYKLLEQQAIHHVLVPGSQNAITPEELFAILKSRWRGRLLSCPLDYTLITSDNPSVWFTVNNSGDRHFMILPVTPECCAIAYDRSMLVVNGSVLSNTDVEVLNRTQVKSMLKALYSSIAFPEQYRSSVAKIWKTHTPPSGFIDETTWSMNVLQYTGSLSFVTAGWNWPPIGFDPSMSRSAPGVMAGGYLQIDETPIRYLSPGHGQTKLGYFWTALSPGAMSSIAGKRAGQPTASRR